MKSSARNYLVTLLLYVSFINDISLPAVNCQEEENYQCLPRTTFLTLLRLAKVTSNVAAYSRKHRNGIASLNRYVKEDIFSPEVCLPLDLYLDLVGDPAEKIFEDSGMKSEAPVRYREGDEADEDEEEEEEKEEAEESGVELDSEKRSIATLAKNGDLPISIQLDKSDEEEEEEEEEEDEEAKRSLATLVHDASSSGGSLRRRREELEAFLGRLADFEKRNVAALARDFALQSGRKRNVAALARDFALPPSNSGKRNVAALARDFALPVARSGKRNVAALARDFALPSGKRNVASLARDFALPYGKRYFDAIPRAGGPSRLRSYGSGDLYGVGVGTKRNVAALARDWTLPTQNRFGRSLRTGRGKDGEKRPTPNGNGAANGSKITNEEPPVKIGDPIDEKNLESLAAGDYGVDENRKTDTNNNRKLNSPRTNAGQPKRPKRQIEFSDEYPLPVMQNDNVLDYEEIIDALTGDYPNAEKRFMAAGEPMTEMREIRENEEPIISAPAAKRHIGALARLGWLPSFRASRFSRSPRYLVNRENSADGTSADYPADSSSRSLGLLGRTSRYSRSRSQNFGDCRHGFNRYLLSPQPLDKLLSDRLIYTNRKTA